MNNTIKNILIFLTVIILFNSCQDDMFNNEATLYYKTIKVVYPDNYNKIEAEGINVKLTNTYNGLQVITTTNEKGIAIFENLTKGNYRISANKKLLALEAIELGDTIANQTHISNNKKINLNASIQNIEIKSSDEETIKLTSSIPGDILIKEVYYTGSTTPNGKAYYSDHFIELFNNTDKVIFADGIYIATVYGNNGISSSNPSEFSNIRDSVVLSHVWKIPGSGSSNPIDPGKSIIIAQDAMNHKDDINGNPNSIDLSKADFETYILRPENQKDVDFIEVPNLIEIFSSSNNIHDWIFHSAGPAIIVFKTDNLDNTNIIPKPNNNQGHTLMVIPNIWILDSFEALANSNSGEYKRIPIIIDAGFTFCNGRYNKQSCRRKIESIDNGRIILQDFNNSNDDFEIIDPPTPGEFY